MSKKNIVLRVITNTYVKNILLMLVIFVALIFIVLFALNSYTKHNESVAVPSVKGLQVEDAIGILRSSNLNYEIVDSIYQAEGTPGSILEQIPKADSKVKKERSIYLIIKAKSQQLVEIPSLEDFSRRQAEAQLNALGFTRIVVEEVPSAYKGIVLSVSYKGKTLLPRQKVPKGAALKMTVGAGGEEESDSTSETTPAIDKSFFE